jgi:hypothetical protein
MRLKKIWKVILALLGQVDSGGSRAGGSEEIKTAGTVRIDTLKDQLVVIEKNLAGVKQGKFDPPEDKERIINSMKADIEMLKSMIYALIQEEYADAFQDKADDGGKRLLMLTRKYKREVQESLRNPDPRSQSILKSLLEGFAKMAKESKSQVPIVINGDNKKVWH